MASFCLCLRESKIDLPVNIWSTIAEFFFSMVLAIAAIIINWTLLKQLRFEMKNKPLGRKGNVIEPIMRWFCVLQMYYSPIYFLHNWMTVNGVIPLEIPSLLCMVLSDIVLLGRLFMGFNSVFVVTLRYIYIVYDKKANQWKFKNVGRLFQIASVVIPLLVTTLTIFTLDPFLAIDRDETARNCPTVYNASLHDGEDLTSFRLQLSYKFLPGGLVNSLGMVSFLVNMLVFLNVIDAVLYLQIFRKMKR